jgi:hypothetical protein
MRDLLCGALVVSLHLLLPLSVGAQPYLTPHLIGAPADSIEDAWGRADETRFGSHPAFGSYVARMYVRPMPPADLPGRRRIMLAVTEGRIRALVMHSAAPEPCAVVEERRDRRFTHFARNGVKIHVSYPQWQEWAVGEKHVWYGTRRHEQEDQCSLQMIMGENQSMLGYLRDRRMAE